MMSLTHLWHACESLLGSRTVNAHWRRLLGEEYLLAKVFFTPRQEGAKAYPCPDCGCSHKVVRHNEDDIVAVCQCDPKSCSDIHLTRQDIVLWEIDWYRLGEAVARAMGLQHLAAAVPGLSRTLQIGRDSRAVPGSPVYLTVQHRQSNYQRVALTILAKSKTPFVLLTPTMDLCPQSILDDVRSSGSVLLALSDALVVGADAQVLLSPFGVRAIDEFRAMHAPQPSASTDAFPTPPDTPWEAIYMRFTDTHTLYIRIGDRSRHYGYADLGMYDRRSNRPSVHWRLLRDFADNHGVFTWDHPNADPKKQKQKEDLAKALRGFFRISGDPIRKFRDEKGRTGWECVFTIEPES